MHLRAAFIGLALAICASGAGAQDISRYRGANGGCVSSGDVPNSPVTRAVDGGIFWAFYHGPADSYPHGVLGDAIEAEAFNINIPGYEGICDNVKAGDDRVFEDVAPRLIDVTGDGQSEVVVVASHRAYGARLEVYGYPSKGQAISLIAHTPYIGRSFRWLAPLGGADLDGDGKVELAYIDRPHLAKTLRVWRYDEGDFSEVANLPGLTNHRIGQDFIGGGIRDCGQGPEMITADANWQNIMATVLREGVLETRAIAPFEGERSLADALICH